MAIALEEDISCHCAARHIPPSFFARLPSLEDAN